MLSELRYTNKLDIMRIRSIINAFLDTHVASRMVFKKRAFSAFQFLGYSGLVVAVLLAMGMVISMGLSPIVMALVILVAVLSFLGLAMVTKIITGEERLTYYHHEIAVIAATIGVLAILRQPILPYLDVTILGVGAFLAFGRAGCFMVGCCHGRPSRWGVRYREQHALDGFGAHFVNVRLFPIQAVESLAVFFIVLAGCWFVLTGRPPGTAFAWYVISYDLVRYCFEFLRGDPERPYLWGFSEAQWTSLALMVVVVWVESVGGLPFEPWHLVATLGLASVMLMISAHRVTDGSFRYNLLHAAHMKEIADIVRQISVQRHRRNLFISPMRSDAVHIACTSLGIYISGGNFKSIATKPEIRHITFSMKGSEITQARAQMLADLLIHLQGHAGPSRLIAKGSGVFHLLLLPETVR